MRTYKFAAIDMTNLNYTIEDVCKLHRAEQGYMYQPATPTPDWLGDDYDWEGMCSFMNLAYAEKFKIKLNECGIFMFDENANATFWATKHTESEVQASSFAVSNKKLPMIADEICIMDHLMHECYEVSTGLGQAIAQINERIDQWLADDPNVPDYWIWERVTLTQLLDPYLEDEQELFKKFFKLKFTKW